MKIGFIGCGNMASAFIGGLLDKGFFGADEICASDKSEKSLERAREKFGISTTQSNPELTEKCDIVVLSVKPQFYDTVMKEIKDKTEDKLIITFAPGITLRRLSEGLGEDTKIIRTMPNTPALAGEGMTGVCRNKNVSDEELSYILGLLSCVGAAEVVDEGLMDCVVAVSGSSPAYVFMLIEAMADAAVAGGMARSTAYRFAAQAVLGSAKMVLETGLHPGELKDMVCSPGGTTIAAVKVLEEKGLRAAVMSAMEKCMDACKGF